MCVKKFRETATTSSSLLLAAAVAVSLKPVYCLMFNNIFTMSVGTYSYTFKSVIFESVKVKSVKIKKMLRI